MNNIAIDPLLKDFSKVLTMHGKKAYLVGGAVRDIILKKKSSDWDIATDAHPLEVKKMFRTVIPTGIKHGTLTVLYKGKSIEITSFRKEAGYSDGRHPDEIEYAATIEEDLSRRDFTMNAIAASLPDGIITDPFNGQADIKNKLIRCVGNAKERFNEDGLRPLRALRFVAQLNFNIENTVLDAITASLNITQKVSAERVRDEFEKIIRSNDPVSAIRLMEQTGLLALLLPELQECRGVEQKGYHDFDVLDHSLLALDWTAHNGCGHTVRLAGLFHDLGKPKSALKNDDGVWTFYNHEKYSVEITNKIMKRLRYSNSQREEVVHLIEEHMFHYEDIWSDAAVRRFVSRVGEDNLQNLFELRFADSYALKKITPPYDLLLPFQKRIEKVLEKSRAFSLKDMAVKGHDLIELGIPAGKHLGIILNRLLEAVIEDPELNTKEKLLEIAAELDKNTVKM
ncbi:MAG: CCA tRNA nucleotidyltransferase [Spirochaetaceae bacterium]|jgi:tRNA nucleotidyltransferase/poly(A) polymerase|nr:CCA tRNA nucleotidyltransferase [Spirochaetaceae bacterium]